MSYRVRFIAGGVAVGVAGAVALACSAGSGGGGGKGSLGSGGGSQAGGAGGIIGSGGSGAGGGGGTTVVQTDSGAGGTLGEGEECEGISQQAENTIRPVDIVWAVDTSPSLVTELTAMEAVLNQDFAQYILNQGIDLHVVLIAAKKQGGQQCWTSGLFEQDCGICFGPPLGGAGCADNPPVFAHVDNWVGSHNALGRLTGSYSAYKPVLRQNSVKYLAVVSDDDAEGITAQGFVDQVNALDPGWWDVWKFFGIYCTGGSSCGFGVCAATGTVYDQVAQLTGGQGMSLCTAQGGFTPLFQQMAQTIVDSTTISCEWDIPPAPPGETLTPGQVNVKYTPSSGGAPVDIFWAQSAADCDATLGGWYYDDNVNPTKIFACPASCTQIQSDINAKVDIKFGCDTIPIPK